MHEFDGVSHFHDAGGEIVLGQGDEIIWTTVGVDVGSATCQIVFARITLARDDSRYVVADRKVLHESEIILTPYSAPGIIDAARIGEFVQREFAAAGQTRETIDTGAVILTGLALASANARTVADAVSEGSGAFVAVSAGDVLEARLAASGAGAAHASTTIKGVLVHIDVGGGTTKLSAWQNGKLLALAAMDVGARLVTLDNDMRVLCIEEPAQKLIDALGLNISTGEVPPVGVLEKLAQGMADDVLRQAWATPDAPRFPSLLRTTPLVAVHEEDDGEVLVSLGNLGDEMDAVSTVMFSGGVSEYVYGREERLFGDMGLVLGRALRRATILSHAKMLPFERGIRATVLGVSQYSVKLSGNTVFVSDETLLPLRNVPVVQPGYDFSLDRLEEDDIAFATSAALAEFLDSGASLAGVAVQWDGSATFDRVNALARGLVKGAGERLAADAPLIVVLDGDIGGVLGAALLEESKRPIVCLDGVNVGEFDHIDIGAFAAKTRALPVVVKSLLFSK